MTRGYPYFSACGVEIELMIANGRTLAVSPSAKQLIDCYEREFPGSGAVGNELVQHVIEFRTEPPPASPWMARTGLLALYSDFFRCMENTGLCLLGTGMHPWFLPAGETRLWEWDYADIYRWYDRVFDCTRHGFSNLQSIHLNLPFQSDDEFGTLHGVIRALLPVIPGLCASTPFFEGDLSSYLDTRLEVYRRNQEKYPVITGDIIPEAVYTEKAYHETVFKPLERLIKTLPDGHMIDSQWLNSRGAIARFDRGSIEVRLMDTQECLDADLACAELVFRTVRHFCYKDDAFIRAFRDYPTDKMLPILEGSMKDGDGYTIQDSDYLALFGICEKAISIRDFWHSLMKKITVKESFPSDAEGILDLFFREGCLARRILLACGGDYSRTMQEKIYRRLRDCEMENRVFED